MWQHVPLTQINYKSFIFSKRLILVRVMVDPEPIPGALGVR